MHDTLQPIQVRSSMESLVPSKLMIFFFCEFIRYSLNINVYILSDRFYKKVYFSLYLLLDNSSQDSESVPNSFFID